MKKVSIVKKIAPLLLMSVCMLMACQIKQSGSTLEFSSNASEEASSYNEKTIYINEDREKIKLATSLDLDCGEVSIQVVSAEDGAVVWENSYEQSSDFSIELKDLKADSEYIIKTHTIDTRKVHLTITSTECLVKDIERPSKQR